MDFDSSRRAMVDEQIKNRGITQQSVLDAFLDIARHEFVPEEYKKSSYEDHPLPIGHGQTISQPYIVALMVASLNLNGGEKVLEIGSGSGYCSAIISRIAKEVVAVERLAPLAEQSRNTFERLGITNVKVIAGDGSIGYGPEAPYDGILVSCSAPDIPEPYKEQLNVGGRLVIPVGDRFTQVMTLVEKKKKGYDITQICGCVFVPLIGKFGWKG